MAQLNSAGGNDFLSRRSLLRSGVAAGISLFTPNLGGLAHGKDDTRRRVAKTIPTVVWISFDGGKSSIDSYDPKPDAEAAIRGPFGTIPTAIPGIRFSEHCVEMARTGFRHGLLIRSVVTTGSLDHVTGMRQRLRRHPDDGPHLLSQHAARNGGIQPFFTKSPDVIKGFDYDPLAWGVPGIMLNMPYDPATQRLQAPRIAPMTPRLEQEQLPLLRAFEREAPPIHSPAAETMDRVREQAISAMRRAGTAIAITDKELEAYGGTPSEYANNIGITNNCLRSIAPILLTVRKLVEQDITGAIGVRLGYHDLHSYLVDGTRAQEPIMDKALSVFITELADRGLLEKTVVVLSSEFGRTNRMNGTSGEGDGFAFGYTPSPPGRDHGDVSCAWMFGGGLKKGFDYGATDARGLKTAHENVTAAQLADVATEALNTSPDRAKRSRLPPFFA